MSDPGLDAISGPDLFVACSILAAGWCFWLSGLLHLLLTASPEVSCCDWIWVSCKYNVTQFTTHFLYNSHIHRPFPHPPCRLNQFLVSLYSDSFYAILLSSLMYPKLRFTSDSVWAHFSVVYSLLKSLGEGWVFLRRYCPLQVTLICQKT